MGRPSWPPPIHPRSASAAAPPTSIQLATKHHRARQRPWYLLPQHVHHACKGLDQRKGCRICAPLAAVDLGPPPRLHHRTRPKPPPPGIHAARAIPPSKGAATSDSPLPRLPKQPLPPTSSNCLHTSLSLSLDAITAMAKAGRGGRAFGLGPSQSASLARLCLRAKLAGSNWARPAHQPRRESNLASLLSGEVSARLERDSTPHSSSRQAL